MTESSQYPADVTYVSVTRTFPDLTGWSLPTLLNEYGDLSVRQREAVQLDAPELADIEQDMAAVADEIERRTRPAEAEESAVPAATYVRHSVERLTAEVRRPEQDSSVWDVVHLLSIITTLDVRGYGDAIRAAADEQCRTYRLPAQAVVYGKAAVA